MVVKPQFDCAGGEGSKATERFSCAIGNHVIAASASQTVIGKYNTQDASNAYSLIIGNGGSDTTRSNALTVGWGGDITAPIPCILAVIGAVLNGVVSGFSVESIVYGAVMGLASTGLHQAFTQFIEGKNNISTEEDDTDGVHDHQ
ncbi:hypothetical protein HQK10_11620 [Blautia massiliensis]|nr:hypothetical protein [Blautia massiliensis (ex Durand et al. 2017)]